MNVPKIGLMTFHAAHNYGSVLQAYATQVVLDKLGVSNEIVNYRLPNQLAYYNTFYSPRFGLKTFIQRLVCLPEFFPRRKRARKFEDFINGTLRLSANTFHSIRDLRAAAAHYPILLAGSDQVWNRHCKAEFATEPPESILAYLLDFGSPDAQRISFSSSVGAMTQCELMEFTPQLRRFSTIAMRETSAAGMVAEITGHPVATTLDPTLMLGKADWLTLSRPCRSATGGYILVYSLKKLLPFWKMLRPVQAYAKSQHLPVVCLSPFSPVPAGVRCANAAGPREFLSLIANARLVVTDSFHGTAFSVNFSVPFFVVESGTDHRKNLLLRELGLDGRILRRPEELETLWNQELDFQRASEILEAKRKESFDYLANALGAVCSVGNPSQKRACLATGGPE